ncbi:hypothetical protein [Marivita hallyeonensis]|uniref:Uncharacterized protein n=1 Tax=Marivita hallyeonensis TaxID=996342 RepID=A0A1M5XAI0_9RHOB|nr:hypothetical protein [Marivita hallyeonensis]SHH96875.1 hypothetical protein SAMN05443551_3807 [Marivita hallyeonensis]
MKLTSEQLVAFEELGRKLEEVGWEPKIPDAAPFDQMAPDEKKGKIRKAISFLRERGPEVRASVCDGTNVKLSIQTAGNVVSATTDAIVMAGGMIVPAATIANALVQYGLGNYCAKR